MLDPIVATPAPSRSGRGAWARPQTLAPVVSINTGALTTSPPEAVSVLELVVMRGSIDFPIA